MTQKQRIALDAFEGARAAGQGLSEYARAHGLDPRQVHDAVSVLRRRGDLPPTGRPRAGKGFVAIRVASPQCASTATGLARTEIVCRVIHAAGLVIECRQWPPAQWLLSLVSGRGDAAS
jgi:hypothetical protein